MCRVVIGMTCRWCFCVRFFPLHVRCSFCPSLIKLGLFCMPLCLQLAMLFEYCSVGCAIDVNALRAAVCQSVAALRRPSSAATLSELTLQPQTVA